ncbi:hypothetical protein GCM10027347_57160 [Larkinella harenae]
MDRILLLVNLLDAHNQPQEVTCTVPTEEDAFDVVSYLAMGTDQLQAAYLIDREMPAQVLKLPTEVFNGDCFSKPIKRLQKQWRTLLEQRRPANNLDLSWLSELTRRRIKVYESQITRLTKTIQRLETILRQSKSIRDIYRRNVLVHRHHSLLARYQQQLRRVKEALTAAESRLVHLDS